MPLYETVFLVRPDVSGQQVDGLSEAFSEIVRSQQGSVTKVENWGLKSLSYRIRKSRKAHYVLLNVDASPAALLELERNLRINEDVLRYMTIRVEAHEPGPSAMMQSRASRDERRRERGDRLRDEEPFGGGEGRGPRPPVADSVATTPAATGERP